MVEQSNSQTRSQSKSTPVRERDKFRDADGVWQVIAASFGRVELQLREPASGGGLPRGSLVHLPTATVKTLERVS